MIYNNDLETTQAERAIAEQGMRSPTVATLHTGEAIFRFASTKKPATGEEIPSDQWARGAWWFREDDYRRIVGHFQAGKLGFGTVARSAAAVQPSWSLMDISIKAYLVADIKVYVGAGRTQYRDELPNGMVMTLTGWPGITQVYIPGMRGPSIWALRIVRQKIITTDGFGFPTRGASSKKSP